MGEPAPLLSPAEEAAVEETVRRGWKPVVIQGGRGTAVAAEEVAASGFLAAAATVLVFFTVLLWPSEIGPEPSMSSDPSRKPDAPPQPVPEQQPVTQPCPKEVERKRLCDEWAANIKDAIGRKRDRPNDGLSGLKHRYAEMEAGPCGPGQRPYRVKRRDGVMTYVKSDVWKDHVDTYNQQRRFLQRNLDNYLNAKHGCAPDPSLDKEAKEWINKGPPQFRPKPDNPCIDSTPPPGWSGPLELPSSRGL